MRSGTWKALAVAGQIALVAAFGRAQTGNPFRLVFNDTKTSIVLQSISYKTGRNIMLAGDVDPAITLNVLARNYDEAIKFVTVASGLIYRRVDATYIVATPSAMKHALATFGQTREVDVSAADTTGLARQLESSYPYLTAVPSPYKVTLKGTREDIDEAQATLALLDEPKPAPVIDIYNVRNVSVAQLGKTLDEMFSGVVVKPFAQTETTGMLVVSGPPDSVKVAMAMAGRLDTKDGQPIVEGQAVKVYEVRYSSGPALKNFLSEMMPALEVFVGPDSYSPTSPGFRPLSGALLGGTQGGGSTGLSGLPNLASQATGTVASDDSGINTRFLVLRGRESAVTEAIALLHELDQKPMQVMVQVQVVDYSPSDSSNIGMSWSWTRFGFYEVPPGTGIDTQGNPGSELEQFFTKPAGFGQFSRVPWTFQSILGALVEKKEAKLLATPSVQVIDNEDANIFIGDTIRARVSQTGALGGQTVQIVEFPIGIILLLRPRVNADGDITMRIHPVVSTITAIDQDNIPQTSAREAETTVRVKDGETVVIGGLIRDEMSKVVREVPFLSQIPIIGELFRNRTTSNRKSEILVFITPKIIRDGEQGQPPAKVNKNGGQ